MTAMDILATVTTPEQESAFAALEYLGKRWDAHLNALYLAPRAEPIVGDPAYTATLWAQVVTETQKAGAAAYEAMQKRVARIDASVEVRREEVYLGTIEGAAGRHAMHADLCIMQAPKTAHEDAAFEGALFQSGRPVLLMPQTWKAGTIGKRVVVAWKAKREAARALADAAPFLADADQVTVVTVDAENEGDGRDIARHLAHKGLKVELRNLDGMGRPAEAALLDEARTLSADLLVMGGYGQSRLRQFVFGGVTRAVTRDCPLPVLMSH
jgi:nucleotide-binding universal stress UspA family protein